MRSTRNASWLRRVLCATAVLSCCSLSGPPAAWSAVPEAVALLAAAGGRLKDARLHLLLSGVEAKDAIEVKLNGVMIPEPTLGMDGWLVLAAPSGAFAVGGNLVSVRVPKGTASAAPAVIEKLEAHVRYHLE